MRHRRSRTGRGHAFTARVTTMAGSAAAAGVVTGPARLDGRGSGDAALPAGVAGARPAGSTATVAQAVSPAEGVSPAQGVCPAQGVSSAAAESVVPPAEPPAVAVRRPRRCPAFVHGLAALVRHAGPVATAVVAATVLPAAGCSPVGVRTPGGGRVAGPAPRIAAYDIAPAPRTQVRVGGTLTLAIGSFPAQWNCWYLGGSSADTVAVLRTVLPTLFRSDQNGTVTPDPDYLAGARVARTRPKQVVVYDLNPKARWSDGRPIGARDFAALWHAAAGRDPAYPTAAATGYDRIESVAPGAGPHQVVVTFARPFGEWRSLFGPLYPAAAIDTPARWSGGWLDRIPVTGGPFRIERLDPVAQTVSVVRDPAWWGPRARLDRVVFRHLAAEAMPGALLNGEIDGFDAGADAAAYRRVAGAAGVSVRIAAGPDFAQLTFNGAAPALADPRVRRAVAAAIDRRVIARSALAGLPWPVRLMNDHVYVDTQRGYRDNAGAAGRYDPALAQRLLDAAGWRRAGPLRRRDGRTLTLRYVYPAGVPASGRTGELIQAMLGRVGVATTLRPVPDAGFFARYLVPGAYDLTSFTWHGTAFPISAMQPVYARPAGGDVRQNLARVGSARLDAVLDRAIGRLDPAAARRDANLADRMIWAEVHSLPLYQRPQIVPVRRSVANWGAFGLDDPVWTDVGFRTEAGR